MITYKKRKQHVEKEGKFCPYCYTNLITTNRITVTSFAIAGQVSSCDICHKELRDIYVLVDVEEVKPL